MSVPPVLLMAALVALSGCAQRRIHITSEPSGALVYLNDVEVGRTPVDVDFTFYGTYDVRLHKEGYEPLLTGAKAKAPWYEYPGPDIVAEMTGAKTIIEWHFELTPAETDPDAMIERARALRERMGAPAPTGDGDADADADAAGDDGAGASGG